MSTDQKKSPVPRQAATALERQAGMVCDHPATSVAVVFGIGIVAGMVVSRLLGGPHAPPTLGRRTELAAEQLGRQMLGAIAGVLPASLAKHIVT